MDLDGLWIKREPAEKSVSLTLVLISFSVCIIAMGLEMVELVKNTSMSFEFFCACSSLHFGKSWISSKGQSLKKE